MRFRRTNRSERRGAGRSRGHVAHVDRARARDPAAHRRCARAARNGADRCRADLRSRGDHRLQDRPQGVITYANDVFVRVSGYAEREILGSPHNLIRHPAMPRAVFQLMWEVIPAGREIFAYVVNLAADGGHYWVLAHVTPSFAPDGSVVGYHSNRRWVPPATRRTVGDLYARIRAVEDAQSRTPDRIAAGRAALDAALADAGATYDEFVWSLAAADDASDAPGSAVAGVR
ncbi:PAS domain-containing protein [Cellulomonas sp. ES6]|uniref:PAS domain-containing protein n=1 Tax=Cellulomonas sp. ES6 TaxID=3039384 RepID=UPI0032D59656